MRLLPAIRLAGCALALALGAAVPAHATPQRYAIDAARSRVEFRVHYLGLFTLGGQFSGISGVVTFDPDHWENLEVAIQIPVDSLQTRPEFWRSEMLGPRFFDGGQFPTIGFHAAGAERLGDETGEAGGTLTLHGMSGPVRLRARISALSGTLEVDGETLISRSAFRLGATLPFASDEVTVTMRIRAVPANPP